MNCRSTRWDFPYSTSARSSPQIPMPVIARQRQSSVHGNRRSEAVTVSKNAKTGDERQVTRPPVKNLSFPFSPHPLTSLMIQTSPLSGLMDDLWESLPATASDGSINRSTCFHMRSSCGTVERRRSLEEFVRRSCFLSQKIRSRRKSSVQVSPSPENHEIRRTENAVFRSVSA